MTNRNMTPLEKEADTLRQAIEEQEYLRKTRKDARSFPLGVVLVVMAALSFLSHIILGWEPGLWVGIACVAAYIVGAALRDKGLFFTYQKWAFVIDAVVVGVMLWNGDHDIQFLAKLLIGLHVLAALLYGVVFFLFADE